MSQSNDDGENIEFEYIDDNVHVLKREAGLDHEQNEWCWCDPERHPHEDGYFIILHRWRH